MRRGEKFAMLDNTAPDLFAADRGEAADSDAAGIDAAARTRPLPRVRQDIERMRRGVAIATSLMIAWSIFEVPWEIDVNSSREQAAAVIASKALLLVIGALSLRGRRWAILLLLFTCLTSVLAVAPELPAEFGRVPWLAFLSAVEFVMKLVVVVLLALYLRLKAAGR